MRHNSPSSVNTMVNTHTKMRGEITAKSSAANRYRDALYGSLRHT